MIVFLMALAAIAPLLIVTELQDQFVLPKLVATAAFTGGALAWGAILLARDRWPAARWPAALWWALTAFVVVNLLSFAFAIDWRYSLFGEYFRYQGLATVLLYLLLFAVAAVAVRTPRDLRWLLIAVFAGAVAASIYGLMQKTGVAWWPERLPERPGSTVSNENANAFGAFLLATTSASVYLVLSSHALWQRLVFGGGIAVMVAALGVTVSQSAFLAAGVVIVLWALVAVWRWSPGPALARPSAPEQPRGRTRSERRRRQRQLQRDEASRQEQTTATLDPSGRLALKLGIVALAAVPLVLAAFIMLFVGLPGREAVTDAFDNENVQGRLNLWWLGLEMAADRPLVGHGQDAYSLLFADYRNSPDLEGIGTKFTQPESSHNFYVDLLANTGVLGLLAFLGLVGAVFWYAGPRVLSTDDPSMRIALIALGIGVTGYLAAIFFGFSEAMTTWLFWLLLGAMAGLLAQTRSASEASEPAPPPSPLLSGAAAAALMAAGVVAVGWASTLVAADLAAAQADAATQRIEFDAAARLSGRAVTLNPLQKRYLLQEAQVYERGIFLGLTQSDAVGRSIDLYETALHRFRPQAFDVWSLAQTKSKLAKLEGTPIEELVPDFERALSLDEFNSDLRRLAVSVYRGEGLEDLARFHEGIIYCWSGLCE